MLNRLFRRTQSEYNFRITPADTEIRVSSKETLLQAALNQGVPFPYNCRAGGCGECKCRLVEGKVKELTDKSYLLSAEEIKENYILACQSIPKSDVVVEVTLERGRPEHPIIEISGTITALKPLTHDILHVEMGLDQPMGYTAGQYAEIIIPAEIKPGASESRSYSFACAPDQDGQADQLDFFIRKVPGGAFTEWLFNRAKAGTKLVIRGPYSDFYLRPGTQPIICIAGGSGFAPIKAILEQAHQDKKSTRDVVFFFGARTQDDLYCLDEIEQIRRHWIGRFEFAPILSAEPENSTWQGLRGLITDHLQVVVGERIAQHQAYLCGPPTMIDSCIEELSRGGMNSSQVHFDKFLDRSHLVNARL
ncbi:MAG TPA: 2Fe-2S iron-sulfur cluster binding domain-containing protein [Rugosibacter sp.]